MIGRANAVAVVTGGARGIGAAIATRLGALGHPVAVVDRDGKGVDRVTAAIVSGGGSSTGHVCDIANIREHGALLTAIETRLGPPLVLINNAAVGGGERFDGVTPERFDAVFGVSVRATFFLTQAAVPAMRAAGWGRIVNISSLIAARGEDGNPHYAGAKAAMMGFTRAWSRELAGDGITANTVLPPLTDTPMARDAFGAEALGKRGEGVPAGRLATGEDTAALVAFLASPEADFVTGQAISANGGEFVGAL